MKDGVNVKLPPTWISRVTAAAAEENKAIPLSNAKEGNIIAFRDK
jgi:hypothetical protein